MKSALKIILILATLISVGIVIWYFQKDSESELDKKSSFHQIENGTIEETVTSQGKLEPKEYVDVGAQVSGQLKSLKVDIGDVIKKGDLLAEIDPRLYEAKVEADTAGLETLQAQINEEEANLSLAQIQLDRNTKLIEARAISQSEFDIAANTVNVSIARVASLKAQLKEAKSTLEGDKTNLSYTKIFATMDGTISQLYAREGQTLNANQTAPSILQIANLNIMTIRAQVAEADVMKLKVGLKAKFSTLGNLDLLRDAVIRQILPTPQLVNDVVLYDVLLDVDNKEQQLMNGMSTQVFFTTQSAEDVPLIPVTALNHPSSKDGKDAYYVKVKNGNDSQERIVHVGLMDRLQAEVKDGLQAGETIIIPSLSKKPTSGNAGGGRFGGGPRL
jgi:macrolide-specific efflux system membrane fusion protein